MVTRRPFWKWHCWKSIGFCLWPPSTCIWNLKLKFQSKLDLCSGNHVVYRQTDRRTDKVNPVYPPSNFVGRGYNKSSMNWSDHHCTNAGNCYKIYILCSRKDIGPYETLLVILQNVWWFVQNHQTYCLIIWKTFHQYLNWNVWWFFQNVWWFAQTHQTICLMIQKTLHEHCISFLN